MQISVENTNNLLIYLKKYTVIPRGNVTPYEVKGSAEESAKQRVTRTRLTRLSKTCWVACVHCGLDP